MPDQVSRMTIRWVNTFGLHTLTSAVFIDWVRRSRRGYLHMSGYLSNTHFKIQTKFLGMCAQVDALLTVCGLRRPGPPRWSSP